MGRLNDIERIQILKQPEMFQAERPSWAELAAAMASEDNGDEARKKAKAMKQWCNALNQSIKSLSGQTYFSFIKLPELPPILDDAETEARLSKVYAESLY